MDRCAACAPGLVGWELRNVFHHLKRPEVFAPETLQELIRVHMCRIVETSSGYSLLCKQGMNRPGTSPS